MLNIYAQLLLIAAAAAQNTPSGRTLTVGAYRFTGADAPCCRDVSVQLAGLFQDAIYQVATEIQDVPEARDVILSVRLHSMDQELDPAAVPMVFASPRWLASVGGHMFSTSGPVNVETRIYISPTSRVAVSFQVTGEQWARAAQPTLQAVIVTAAVARAQANRASPEVVSALLRLAYDHVGDCPDVSVRDQLTERLDRERAQHELGLGRT